MMARYLLLFLSLTLVVEAQLTLAAECSEREVAFSRLELIDILRRDGFSGTIDEYVELNRIGYIEVGNACFVICTYSREFHAASNIHQTTRLLVIRDYQYLGMYPIDNLPTGIKGTTIEFPGRKAEGNAVVFDKVEPPETIYLDGEVRPLFK